jgi:hypothetical protein
MKSIEARDISKVFDLFLASFSPIFQVQHKVVWEYPDALLFVSSLYFPVRKMLIGHCFSNNSFLSTYPVEAKSSIKVSLPVIPIPLAFMGGVNSLLRVTTVL